MLVAAHPRSRGENSTFAASSAVWNGSSPLTRGKLNVRRVERRLERLIPAHAGKTQGPNGPSRDEAAHPRSRGENIMSHAKNTTVSGSSPLTRGKRHEVRGQGCAAGLIPAHAGKTGRWRSRSGVWTAHPRSRGENAVEAARADLSTGSSPLTRGKRKTVLMFFAMISGSSPLTRGKRCITYIRRPCFRLIPAHAGKTLWWTRRSVRAGAHPRSRGENKSLTASSRACIGSSPLTRGKRAACSP